MKQFFWRFFICVVPCLLAAVATLDATRKYYSGEPGGFKLGVDLVGGTILVYEIDLRKNLDSENKFDPVKDINVLAESLKRRIDPNDIYNITIRPAGGEGRIEIILPTGGTHRARKAEENWRKLVKSLEDEFLKGSNRKIEVGRGKILELADQIQSIQSDTLWEKKLFGDEKGWARLKDAALQYWARIDLDLEAEAKVKAKAQEEKKSVEDGPLTQRWNALKPGQLNEFKQFVLSATARSDQPTTLKTIETWIKKQAWQETMHRVRDKWLVQPWTDKRQYEAGEYVVHDKVTYLALTKSKNVVPPGEKERAWKALNPDGKPLKEEAQPYHDEMDRIAPDRIEQLTTFVLTKGAIIGQAALTLLQPIVGEGVEKIFDDGPTAKEVRAEIRELYGPPVQEIMQQIDKFMKETGQSKDLSVEEVQRIKDLVSKVGSLEFRILANAKDDSEAIADAQKQINPDIRTPEDTKDLQDAQDKGLPPPGPRKKENNQFLQKIYTIKLARGTESRVTYSWVELGPEERRALNLDNAARTDASRNTAWHEAARLRNLGKAGPLPVIAGSTEQYLLQGAIFYSRECKDRNLPEEERRRKEFEYFVLARDPEFREDVPTIRTKKIDGSFLDSAYGGPGQDLRPTVHFRFNVEGGELFRALTRKNVTEGSGPENTKHYRHLAVILDGMVMSAPTINSEIGRDGQISSPTFTSKQVDAQVNILRAGRLPATLKPQPVSESTIAATLGEDTIAAGVNAIVLGFFAVLVFMIIYYRFAGLVASIALLANLLLTVGFMVAVQATFTLSGLAGIVLTVGMAVDANVLIYERLREERERGGSLLQSLRNGYDRALPTILDSHVTTILTGIILYAVGNDNLKGFAVSMIVGLVFSLFTAIVMTRVLFDFALAKGWLKNLTMMKLLSRTDFDFMSIRHIMFGVTVATAVLGVAIFIGRIPNDLSIDFIGGTAYGGKLVKGVTAAELRAMFSDEQQNKILKDGVQVHEIPGTDGRRYELFFPNGDKLKHTVSFSNIPDGNTAAEREATVKARASRVPDPSVDLLYQGSDDPKIIEELSNNKSRTFMFRTTEREPELVQTTMDQLLREESGQQLLKKVYAVAENDGKLVRTREGNRDVRLRFYSEIPPTASKPEEKKSDVEKEKEKSLMATASQSFVKSLLTREMRRAFALKDDKEPLPVLFEVIPEGKDDPDGKYHTLKIAFGPELEEKHHKQVEQAIANMITAFSARPLPDRLENFDSGVATDTRLRALWAVLASWAGILLYLWFRFGSWTFGLAAVTCVIHDIALTLGAIAAAYFIHDTFIGRILLLEDFKLDLTAVASLLTLVGYSVNDKIVVFDRIREVRGKSPDLTPKMINDSINQTLSRTVLTSTTIAAVFLLYVIGGPGLHLFAFIMLVGVIVGTYSSIYIAAPLLLIFGEGKHDDGAQVFAKSPVTTPEGAAV